MLSIVAKFMLRSLVTSHQRVTGLCINTRCISTGKFKLLYLVCRTCPMNCCFTKVRFFNVADELSYFFFAMFSFVGFVKSISFKSSFYASEVINFFRYFT